MCVTARALLCFQRNWCPRKGFICVLLTQIIQHGLEHCRMRQEKQFWLRNTVGLRDWAYFQRIIRCTELKMSHQVSFMSSISQENKTLHKGEVNSEGRQQLIKNKQTKKSHCFSVKTGSLRDLTQVLPKAFPLFVSFTLKRSSHRRGTRTSFTVHSKVKM